MDITRLVRLLRRDTDLTQEAIGRLVGLPQSVISRIESGRLVLRDISKIRTALDGLGAPKLIPATELFATAGDETDEEAEENAQRFSYVIDNSLHADSVVVDALASSLASQRRLEDAVGAGALLGVVRAHLPLLLALVRNTQGQIRQNLVDVAGQWTQFAGWVNAATGHEAEAARCYEYTLELALEAGSSNLAATARSMSGHLAWMSRRPEEVIGLSEAAVRPGTSNGIRALALQQQARGHAMLGERDTVERLLDQAEACVNQAAAHPEDEPDWIYFHNPDFFSMQRARAYLYLGRHAEAIDLLTCGIDALPPSTRNSEWCLLYRLDLAKAHAECGDLDHAVHLAAQIADSAKSTQLSAKALDLQKRLDTRKRRRR